MRFVIHYIMHYIMHDVLHHAMHYVMQVRLLSTATLAELAVEPLGVDVRPRTALEL